MKHSSAISKVCNSCKIEKPLGEFYFNKKIQRHGGTCKVCRREEAKIRAANKPKGRRRLPIAVLMGKDTKPAPRPSAEAKALDFTSSVRACVKRARRYGVWSDLGVGDVRLQYDAQRGMCFYCAQEMTPPTIDHIFPMTAGGANTASNVVLACLTCNTGKVTGDALTFFFKKLEKG